MNPIHPATVPATTAELPPVPLTLEGYAMLHQMMRFRWTAWRALPETDRRVIASDASIGDASAADASARVAGVAGRDRDLPRPPRLRRRRAVCGLGSPAAGAAAGVNVCSAAGSEAALVGADLDGRRDAATEVSKVAGWDGGSTGAAGSLS